MSPRSPGPKPPKIEPFRRPADPLVGSAEVRSGGTQEGESYDGVTFSGVGLDFSTFIGCTFDRTRFDETTLRGVHLVECALGQVDAPVFSAPRSSWRQVELTGSRLGSAELYESTFRSVVITDTKINYLNARMATWTDMIFRNCVIEELDLGHATVNRLRIEGGQIATLDITGARLSDVDLRGAELSHLKGLAGLAGSWVSQDQLTRLAPLLADHLKINVAELG